MNSSFHCQICGREIKASKGLIAHHGYKRPNNRGWQTASCFGARYDPYEVSRDVIPGVIKLIDEHIDACKKSIENLKNDKVEVWNPVSRKFIKKDEHLYDYYKAYHISNQEYDIKCSQRDKTRLQARYDEWKKVQ